MSGFIDTLREIVEEGVPGRPLNMDRFFAVKEAVAALGRFEAFAEAQAKWEAEATLDDTSGWFDDIPDELYDAMLEVQRLRNEAMGS